MSHEVVEDNVAALQAIVIVQFRVVVGCSFQKSYQNSTFFYFEFVGSGVEIGLGCRLDTIGVAAEVNGIDIHGEDFFFAAGWSG